MYSVMISVTCLLLALFMACGAGPDNAATVSVPNGNDTIAEEADSILVVSDILSEDILADYGVYMVDDISGSSTGYIALLDALNASATVVDPSGTAMVTGGQGSGPGEYQWPRSITVANDGSLAVSDFLGGYVRILEPDLTSYVDLTGFIMANPGEMTLLDSGGLAGMRVTFMAEDGESFIGHQTALWNGIDPEPAIVYSESMRPFSLNDFGWSIIVPYPFACSSEGTVFTADVSSERYVLSCYASDGTIIWSVGRPFRRTEKTPEEIEIEKEMVSRRMQQSEHQADYTPDPYHFAVSRLALGPQGNLWAERPGTELIFFDVFDASNGDYLYSASAEADYELLEVTPAGIFAVLPGETQQLLKLELKPSESL